MKVAVDCRMISDSGIGCYLSNILYYLVNNKSISFLLIGDPNKLKKYEKTDNCQILPVSIPIFSLKELFFFPVREINQCDIFYSPNYNIPLGIKIPILSTIHDVLFLDIPEISSRFKRVINYVYIKRVINSSRLVFTVSNFSKERIQYHFPNALHLAVTYNGVSDSLLQYNYIDGDRYFSFPYFLYVGNIKPHKGLKCLLDAYSVIEKKSNYKRKLVIVGKKENFKTPDNYIQEFIRKEDIDNIVFTGYVSDEVLRRIMAEADLLIQPSIYEGFGIPPLEAMILGTPALISDIPVFKEIYSDFPVDYFRCNDVVDLIQKIESCSYKRICLNSELVEKYSYKKSSRIILNIIQSIVE